MCIAESPFNVPAFYNNNNNNIYLTAIGL